LKVNVSEEQVASIFSVENKPRNKLAEASIMQRSKGRRVPPKRQLSYKGVQGVISQITELQSNFD
jgi:hypothetical protein